MLILFLLVCVDLMIVNVRDMVFCKVKYCYLVDTKHNMQLWRSFFNFALLICALTKDFKPILLAICWENGNLVNFKYGTGSNEEFLTASGIFNNLKV